MNTIEPKLHSTMSHMKVAKDLWTNVKERFSVSDGPCIQQLKEDLIECKQKGMTIVAYYGKLKKLWVDLANHEKTPTCTCGRYTCDLKAKLEKRREEEKIHQFLMGLDEATYGIVRSNILSQDPLPSLNKIYSILVQEEHVKNVT